MSKKNREEKIKLLGKEFEYVRIDDIKKNPIIFFEEHSVDLCIKAYGILKPKCIYINDVPFDFLKDPQFSELEEIHVSAAEGVDITPLHSLHHLKSLWVTFYAGYGPKGSLDFSHFPKLETLHCNWLDGSKNLAELKNVQSIFIADASLTDLKIFHGLENLKVLELARSTVESLEGLEGIVNLRELKITGSSNIKSFESLAQVSGTGLERLEITSKNNITALEHIGKLNKLRSLSLEGMQSIDCSAFENNTNLTQLSLKRIKKMTNEEGLSKLANLNSLRLMQIDHIDSLDFLTDLPKLKALNVLPWFIKVKDGYLPLIQKFRALNKLETLFEWDEILDHLDEEGKQQYKEHFGDSPLEFIKKEFTFHCYEDFSEPYTEENYNRVDVEIRRLIDRLIKNAGATTEEKLKYFEATVDNLDKIDEELNLFATGEREYLWDTLDEIAGASGIDVDSLEESDSKNKYFKWPVF